MMCVCNLLNIYYDFYFCDRKNRKFTDIDIIYFDSPSNSRAEPRHDLIERYGELISKTVKVILFNNPQLDLGEFIGYKFDKL